MSVNTRFHNRCSNKTWDWKCFLCFRWAFFFSPPPFGNPLWSKSRIPGDELDSASCLQLQASPWYSSALNTPWYLHQPQHPRGQGPGPPQMWGWPWSPGPGPRTSPVSPLSSYRYTKQSKKNKIKISVRLAVIWSTNTLSPIQFPKSRQK